MRRMTDVHAIPAAHQRVIRVQRAKGWLLPNLRELWAFRELLGFFVWRDIKVRYKQTFLGASWALLQPLVGVLIFSVIFGSWVGIPSQGIKYPLFVVSGLVLWNYFSSSLMLTSTSVVSNTQLVSKVYFPRLIIPIAAVVVPLVDFAVALVLLVAMFGWYGTVPSRYAVFSWIFVVMAVMASLGVGLWFAALNVRYRDIPYVVPFLIQIWLYASPVIYPVSIVPQAYRWVLALNPMTGMIDGFRWTLFGHGAAHWGVYATSGAASVLLLISGLLYFRRTERRFADLV
jgi:lipopolysaccharide transport system permease protein